MIKPFTITNAISTCASKVVAAYDRLFAIEELRHCTTLQHFLYAQILSSIVILHKWSKLNVITTTAFHDRTHICWPYFLNCGDYYWLNNFPHGNSNFLTYALLFTMLLSAFLAACHRKWGLAHFCLLFIWVWLVAFRLILTMYLPGNFDYFLIILLGGLLFFRHKLLFLRLTLVILYFLAGSIKIHPGWILGTYFTTLNAGLPFVPTLLIPVATNLVIALEVFGCWFLLSPNKPVQRMVFLAFVVFHLYSTIIVSYLYPIVCLPSLLVLFSQTPLIQVIPVGRRTLANWLILIFIVSIHLSKFVITGDEKLTLEGNFYGLFMFEANHQCLSSVDYLRDGQVIRSKKGSSSKAIGRCDPYRTWFQLHSRCNEPERDFDRISWAFDHSINGGPFYRIVDLNDVCQSEYHPFEHNDWILLPSSGAQVVGYPRKNDLR